MTIKLSCILFTGILFWGCRSHHDPDNAESAIEWNKMTIKGELSVGTFYGDIDKELIVSTDVNIFKTTDGGKTWRKVAQNVNKVRQFYLNGDTLFAISGWPNYYSLDDGESWQMMSIEIPWDSPKQVITSDHRFFEYVMHADGENALPSQVLYSSDNGSTWKDVFPYKHYITSIYLDAQDKVYVGAGGFTWTESGFVSNNPDDAIIYYTRKK